MCTVIVCSYSLRRRTTASILFSCFAQHLNGPQEDSNALISSLDAIDKEETKLNFEFMKSRIIQENKRIQSRTKSAFE